MDQETTELYEKLRQMRSNAIWVWLGAAQCAYESHGGTGPCPCWMCEARRSCLASRGVKPWSRPQQ